MDRAIIISTLVSNTRITQYLCEYFKDSTHNIQIGANYALYNANIILADTQYLFEQTLERVLPLYGDKTYLISCEDDESKLTKYLQGLAKNIEIYISNNIWGTDCKKHYKEQITSFHFNEEANQ